VPLIRYEITDQITLIGERCTCGSTHRLIEDPYGRLDDCFDYGGRVVHPHVFRSALAARPEITEYQVRQTAAGAHVRVRCTAPLDAPALERELEGGLTGLGLVSPAVTVTPVDHLERGTTGKLLRFVPSRGTA
jgi:phenylacetate-coenzyme A ligase PaaK-like adenylate-forming protein